MNAATIGAGAAIATGGGQPARGARRAYAEQACRGERRGNRERLPIAGLRPRRTVEAGDHALAKSGAALAPGTLANRLPKCARQRSTSRAKAGRRASGAARRRAPRPRAGQAPARRRRRRVRRVAGSVGSVIVVTQAILEPHQAAADPAFHRPQRHRVARRQLGIGQAVEESGADRVALALLELVEARGAAPRARRPASSSSAETRSSASSAIVLDPRRRRAPRRRRQSIARLRAIVASQLIGLARPGSKAPARFQIVRYTSLNTSSAACRSPQIRRQTPKSFAEVSR